MEREITRMARTLYGMNTPAEMGVFLTGEIGRLVGHDSLVLCDGHKATGKSVYHVGPFDSTWHQHVDAMSALMHQVPFIPHYLSNPDAGSVRTFDLMTPDSLRRTEVYNVGLRHLGFEEQLGVHIPTAPGIIRGMLLNRSKAGFSEMDVTVLEWLRPHLTSAMITADQWRRLDDATDGVRMRASVILDADGHPVMASPRTQILLAAWGGGKTGLLPTAVEEWVKREIAVFHHEDLWKSPRRPLRLTGGDSVLVLRLASSPGGTGHVILIEERPKPLAAMNTVRRLSPREREVLDWIASGKSNDEIAKILSVSIHTVRNHVKNILALLGVDNRTSAASLHLRSREH